MYFGAAPVAIVYRVALLFALVDIVLRAAMPFVLFQGAFTPYSCGATHFRSVNEVSSGERPDISGLLNFDTNINDIVKLSWTQGGCFAYGVWFYDVTVPDNGYHSENLIVGSYLAPQAFLWWSLLAMAALLMCTLWRGYCTSSTWSSRPSSFRIQQYNISLASSLANVMVVGLTLLSIMLYVSLVFSGYLLQYSGYFSESQRYALFVCAAAVIAVLHDVVLPGINSSDSHSNFMTTAVQFLLWWLFGSVIYPEFNAHRTLKLEWVKSHDGPMFWILITSPCIVMGLIPMTRFITGILGFARQSTLRDTFYFFKPREDKPHKNAHVEARFSHINRSTDYPKLDGVNRFHSEEDETDDSFHKSPKNDDYPAPWPVPPIYICNTTQHDVIDSRMLITPAATYYRDTSPTTYNHFEITSHHWGNPIVGCWKPPRESSLSTPMASSAAATSATLGTSVSRVGWVGSLTPLVQLVLGVMGMEMGRSHLLRTWGNQETWECKMKNRILEFSIRRVTEACMVCLMMSLSIYHYYRVDSIVQDNFSLAPIGYVNQSGFCVGAADCKQDGKMMYDASSYYTAVVTFEDTHHGYKTLDWMQYITRHPPTDQVLCDKATQDSMVTPCTTASRISLNDMEWFSTPLQHVTWPIGQGENGSGECQTLTYKQLYKTIQSQYPHGTQGLYAALMTHAIIEGRHMCTDIADLNIVLFTMCIYLFGVAILAPSFSKFGIFRSMLYSHTMQVIRRGLNLVSVVPSLRLYPPPEVFLTDGGHIDNTGAYPLLARQCSLILALDSDPTRECSSFYILRDLARLKLGCQFYTPPEETATVDPDDMFLDFRLPRCRVVCTDSNKGEEKDGNDLPKTTDEDELIRRFEWVSNAMRGIDPNIWQPGDVLEKGNPPFYNMVKRDGHEEQVKETELVKGLISHARIRDGHVYVYFMTDASLKVAFESYNHIRNNFRICQAVEDMTGELDIKEHPEHFLDSLTMRAETLRHSVHLHVKYSNGNRGDMYYLRAECDPDDLEKVHKYLADYDPTPGVPWTTMGRYPSHSTMGEGYTWRHINAYAELANTATQHAWASGLKDHLAEAALGDIEAIEKMRGHDGTHWTDKFSNKELTTADRLQRMNPLRNLMQSKASPASDAENADAPATELVDLNIDPTLSV